MNKDNRYGIIYVAVNKINGKEYVGKTTRGLLIKRVNEHINAALNGRAFCYFHKAIKKYGVSNFKWLIVYTAFSEKELNDAEKRIIKERNTYNNGYNLTLGGDGVGGRHPSEDTKKKIRASLLGKKFSLNRKNKISCALKGINNPNYGKHRSNETKNKISIANKGKTFSSEHRQKLSESRIGKCLTDETKKKIGLTSKGRYHSFKTKNKLSLINSGVNHPQYGKKQHEAWLKKRIDSMSFNWLIIDPYGKKLVIKNMNAFCKKSNLLSSSMYEVAKGLRRSCKGFKCKRIYDCIIKIYK